MSGGPGNVNNVNTSLNENGTAGTEGQDGLSESSDNNGSSTQQQHQDQRVDAPEAGGSNTHSPDSDVEAEVEEAPVPVVSIHSELLCFMHYYAQSCSPDKIKRVVLCFYCNDQIKEAKEILWGQFKDKLKDFKRRKTTPQRSEDEAHVADIFEALDDLDKLNVAVQFYALDLSKVPKHSPEEINELAILDRLSALERKFDELKVSGSRNEVNEADPGDADGVKEDDTPPPTVTVNAEEVQQQPIATAAQPLPGPSGEQLSENPRPESSGSVMSTGATSENRGEESATPLVESAAKPTQDENPPAPHKSCSCTHGGNATSYAEAVGKQQEKNGSGAVVTQVAKFVRRV